MNIKKLFITTVLCANVAALFAQDFFTKIDDENLKYIKLEYALRTYKNSRIDFNNVFSNEIVTILLGEKDILNYQLEIFSLGQLEQSYFKLLRNMIYARYGLRFSDTDLDTYFRRFDWYRPISNNVDNQLTEVDKYNLELIKTFESCNENQQDIRWDNAKVGVWQSYFGMATGWGDRFVIHPNNQLEYYYSQMRELPIIIGMNGTYTIKGNVLTWSIKEIFYNATNCEIDWNNNSGYEFAKPEKNIIRLEKPIIYKFPISNITDKKITDEDVDVTTTTMTIGGHDFYKMSNNVTNKF